MTTKLVSYYVDLYPGWQDGIFLPSMCGAPLSNPFHSAGCRRVRVVVELPCFGGSAEAKETVRAQKAEIIGEKVAPGSNDA